MDEKIVVIKLELDVDKYTTSAVKLSKEIADLKKQQSDLKKSGQESSLEFQKNAEILKGLSNELRQTNKTIQDVTKANTAQAGSNDQLRAQLSVLTAQYNSLSAAERDSTNEGIQMGIHVATLTATLKKNESAVGDDRRSVGHYSDALKDLKSKLREARGEMIAIAATLGQDSKEFQVAAQKAGELEDQLGDVKAASKAMATGTEIGQFRNQLAEVGKSLMDLDFKEAAEKAKGLYSIASKITFKETIAGGKAAAITMYETAAAMMSLPIFWIVAGLAAIGAGLYAVAKSSQESAQKQVDALGKVNEKYQQVYDGQLKLSKALGKDTEAIELKKLKLTKASVDNQIKVLMKLSHTWQGLSDDQEKQLEDLRKQSTEALTDIAAKEIEISMKRIENQEKATDKISEATAKLVEKNKAEILKMQEDQRKANEERLRDNDVLLRKMQDQKVEMIKDEELRELAKLQLNNKRALDEIIKSKADNDKKHDALLLQQEAYEQQYDSIRKKYADERKKEEEKAQSDLVAKIKKDAKEMSDANADPELSKNLENNVKKYKEANAKRLKDEKELHDALKKMEDESFALTRQGVDSIFEIKNNQREAEIQGINEETKIKLDALQLQADSGIITQQEFETKSNRIKMDADKKESALKKKQWQSQKKQALIQLAINAAQGVVNAWTVQPAYLAAAQIAAVLISSAEQAAVINSQPMPAFAKSGKVLSGQRIQGSHGTHKYFGNGDNLVASVKKNEVILNERHQQLLGGAETFRNIGVPGFADGGVVGQFVSTPIETQINASKQIELAMQNLPPIFTLVGDINDAQGIANKITTKSEV